MDRGTFVKVVLFPGATSFILFARLAMRLERKSLARIHARIGPQHAGPRGILQPLYDLLKVLGKQIVIPKRADKLAYVTAIHLPPIFLGVVLLSLPIRPSGPVIQLKNDMLFAIAVFTALPVFFAIIARASKNKYSLMGGARSVINFAGFEVAKLVTVLSIARLVGSRSFSDVVSRQKTHHRLIRYLPLAFITLLIITLVETERQPFDHPEAEPEVAYGIATEFSSVFLAIRFSTAYTTLYALSAFMVVVFFGGNHLVALSLGPLSIAADSVRRFVLKLFLLVRFIFLLRGGLMRYRPDQAVRYGRRIALLLAYINLVRTAYLVREVLRYGVPRYTHSLQEVLRS